MQTDISKNRRSLYNVVLENLTEAQRNTPLHRMFYAAEHFLTDDRKKLKELVEETIDAFNRGYNDDVLTGLFLHYENHFVHMVEGSEEGITKHLELLMKTNEKSEFIGKAKILMFYHHITQRFFPRWISVAGRPPTLIAKPNPSCDTEQLGNHVLTVFSKMYNLAGYFRECLEKSAEELRDAISTVSEKCSSFLPEIVLIEFLLDHDDIPELREHAGLYKIIDFPKSFEESVWPIPTDFVPYNVFEGQ
ncbi:testis-expressed protein 47-like [Ctenocephalides felis]|uniref:testis-expressed protein 47-like n=1 Tax=Ctenocephalides felis TaxID=7515 RepID=UPI000E6E4D3E|nr:testis-expressed protein 47-like [Ctenocephalides felis]XP_026464447.1 testis-expressed protein 47-like [Ctenocephalides felis]